MFWEKKPKITEESAYGQRIADAIEKQQAGAKDISEPVWMIVKALEERPKTFRVKSSCIDHRSYGYCVVDLVTGAEFVYSRDIDIGELLFTNFALSKDEMGILISGGRNWMLNKKARVQELKRKRWQRIYERV